MLVKSDENYKSNIRIIKNTHITKFIDTLIPSPCVSNSTILNRTSLAAHRRMILQDDRSNTFPEIMCLAVECSDIIPNWDPDRVCPEIRCSKGVYTPCCECPKCCPPA
ncbi:hypothetical protein MKW98_009702 [Papaver atlanticum]|uniref:Uncharacterized protein n=1 Tax=Papaver atlanticum TaxID=357466 RepID=A0AAD4SWK1_9MAGN|nr:hypothetical protein MKW98_009702 [Papaver atlanticum]